MHQDDVRFFADFSETVDATPEGEPEPTERAAPVLPPFEAEEIGF